MQTAIVIFTESMRRASLPEHRRASLTFRLTLLLGWFDGGLWLDDPALHMALLDFCEGVRKQAHATWTSQREREALDLAWWRLLTHTQEGGACTDLHGGPGE